MNNFFKKTALALAIAAAPGLALADTAETKGGITVKTDDGRFEAKIGGRFHIDAYAFDNCETAAGVECTTQAVGGMFLRRGYITLTGKAYGWKYKSEYDLAAATNPQQTWREAWVATDIAGGELTIGQFKPFRSMEELTSSNEILLIERPYSSASTIYGGGSRQFQMGLGYKLPFELGVPGMLATSVYNLHAIGQPATEGIGTSTRLTVLPISTNDSTLHIGVVYGVDNADGKLGTTVGATTATLAGRNSANQVTSLTQTLGANTAAGESQTTYSAELGATVGPFFLQAEYANATFAGATSAADEDVVSYYVQTSFFLTGETKPYKKDRGTYGTPKPNGESGAFELVARYDFIENKDDVLEQEATQITAGLNWYVNPNVRFMLNYSMGEGETTAVKQEIDAIAVRTQFSF